jgi:cytochrome c oxidase subunit 1
VADLRAAAAAPRLGLGVGRPMKIISTDHKVVARQFLWAGLIFLLLGGGLAMLMRWQWAYPGKALPLFGPITPATYTSLFSNHGLIMIFFAITPILIGALGNFCIPLMIGARDMVFPRLNAASFWLFLASQITVLISLAADVAASAGWTMYPPLSTGIGTPGWGQSAMLVAIFLTGMASLLGAINYITTVIVARAAGVDWMKLPLTIWGLWLTAILTALFVPVLAAAAMLSFGDRVFGTEFFAAATGDPILYQHLFWIFGHPEVYILILPVWGVLGDLIAFFSGRPASWYRGSVYAMIAVTVLSGLVYGHHLYQTGLGPVAGKSFEALTLAISAPAVVLYINWLLTLWGGAIRLTVPMVLCLGTLLVFGAGGLTGLYLGAITPDIALHDSLFVVGHFHLIMAAATFLGSMAALTFWFPRMFGRELGRKLGMVHAVLTIVLLGGTFGMLLASGYAGQPRRYYDPTQLEFLGDIGGLGINRATSHMAFTLGAVQLLFVFNWFWSLWRGKKAGAEPWGPTPLPYDVAEGANVAENESAENESDENESAENESAENESAENESAENESDEEE